MHFVFSLQFRDSFEDKLHFFSEECDHLQGFQLLVDWDGGFGGVASGIAMEIADEYSSKGLFTLLASPLTQPLDKVSYRATNSNFVFTFLCPPTHAYIHCLTYFTHTHTCIVLIV